MANTTGRRKAFADILAHRTPDRVLLDLCGCPLAGLSAEAETGLVQYFGFKGDRASQREQLLCELDIDTRGVGDILTPQKSLAREISDTLRISAWGVKSKFTGLYWDNVEFPLADADVDDLDKYPWPDPDTISEKEVDAIVERARYLHEETDYVVCASHPVFGIFELGCWMCGFEEFMVRMMIDKPFVHRFFEIILAYQKKVNAIYYPRLAPYIDFTSSGDDFATQANLFVSPELFREMVQPYFSERIADTKKHANVPFLHHSCGNVTRLIPQLLESGVNMLNPIQPTGPDMYPVNLKAKFGDSIVFHGGLDTQQVLPNGTKETVTQAVNDLLDVMQPNGGYVFAAAHNLQADVPVENIVTMFRAARAWKPSK